MRNYTTGTNDFLAGTCARTRTLAFRTRSQRPAFKSNPGLSHALSKASVRVPAETDSQLLKLFTMFYVYTVPFCLAPSVGIMTPFVALFLAAGYFGLDQLGAELECTAVRTRTPVSAARP